MIKTGSGWISACLSFFLPLNDSHARNGAKLAITILVIDFLERNPGCAFGAKSHNALHVVAEFPMAGVTYFGAFLPAMRLVVKMAIVSQFRAKKNPIPSTMIFSVDFADYSSRILGTRVPERPHFEIVQTRFALLFAIHDKEKPDTCRYRVCHFICGPYWIRTSDPLLVRQVL